MFKEWYRKTVLPGTSWSKKARTFRTVLLLAARPDTEEDVAVACGFEIEPLSILVRGSRSSETADSGFVFAIDPFFQGNSSVRKKRHHERFSRTISVFLRHWVLGMPLNLVGSREL